MAVKLKSILSRTRWSLLLKAILFGGGWFFLPFWLFALLAIALYVLPVFQPFRFIFPFALTLFLAGGVNHLALPLPVELVLAISFGAIFYLILGIKDLVFTERPSAYGILVFLLTLGLTLFFFARMSGSTSAAGSVATLVLATLFFWLVRGFFLYAAGSASQKAGNRRRILFAAGLTAFLSGEIGLALLAVPMNFLVSGALFFLTAVTLVELAGENIATKPSPVRTLLSFSFFFVFLVVLLALNPWRIGLG